MSDKPISNYTIESEKEVTDVKKTSPIPNMFENVTIINLKDSLVVNRDETITLVFDNGENLTMHVRSLLKYIAEGLTNGESAINLVK